MRHILRLGLAAFAALALTACAGQPAAVPTAVPTAPPTATPPPPTATPVPTAAAAPSGAGDSEVAEAIRAGLAQVEEAESYRVAIEMSATGDFGGAVPGATSGQPMPLLSAEGEVSGTSSRLVLRGVLSTFLGADPDQGLEVVTVDGTSYLLGPAPLLGANEARWYELPSDGSSPALGLQSDQIVGGLTQQDLDLSGFSAGGEESLDGQQCRVYIGDREATLRAFERVGTQGVPGPQSLSEVERAEMRFWICPDGYMHRMALDFEGTAESQTEATAFTLDLRLSDFDADITITAPESPAPLETPALTMPTPAP